MNCTPYLLLVKVTAEAQMLAKILSVAQFCEDAQARSRVRGICGICGAVVAAMGSRHTDCRTFTGYRLSLGVSFRLLRSKSVQIAAREIVLSRFGVGLGTRTTLTLGPFRAHFFLTCSRLMHRWMESLVNKSIRRTFQCACRQKVCT